MANDNNNSGTATKKKTPLSRSYRIFYINSPNGIFWLAERMLHQGTLHTRAHHRTQSRIPSHLNVIQWFCWPVNDQSPISHSIVFLPLRLDRWNLTDSTCLHCKSCTHNISHWRTWCPIWSHPVCCGDRFRKICWRQARWEWTELIWQSHIFGQEIVFVSHSFLQNINKHTFHSNPMFFRRWTFRIRWWLGMKYSIAGYK